MTDAEEIGGPVTEEEMTIAELDERLSALEASVKKNTRRIELHSRVGWTVFVLWLLGFIGTLVWVALALRIFGGQP